MTSDPSMPEVPALRSAAQLLGGWPARGCKCLCGAYRSLWLTIRDVRRVLSPVRVNVLILLLVGVALWLPDQSRDVFRALAEDGLRSNPVKGLVFGASGLSLSMCFTAWGLLARVRTRARSTKLT